MLLRCCLIRCCLHIIVNILSQTLYLVYLYPCLGLGLFMSYLCGLFFIFSLIFIVINHITSFKQAYLILNIFLVYLLSFLDDSVDEESKQFSNGKNSASRCCQFQPGVAYKIVAYKKSMYLLCNLLLTISTIRFYFLLCTV